MTTSKATLQLRPNTTPKFHRAAIGEQLDKLEKDGILKKLSHSQRAAPIVAVPKKDGRFRICGDYKVTINQYLDVDQYPLPKSYRSVCFTLRRPQVHQVGLIASVSTATT